jgi:hypothetical protein
MGAQRELPAGGARRGESPAAEFFETLAFENRPVLPDVPYSTRIDDVMAHNRGWMQQVDAALFGGVGGAVAQGAPVGAGR